MAAAAVWYNSNENTPNRVLKGRHRHRHRHRPRTSEADVVPVPYAGYYHQQRVNQQLRHHRSHLQNGFVRERRGGGESTINMKDGSTT